MKPYLRLWRRISDAGTVCWVLTHEHHDTQPNELNTWRDDDYVYAKRAAITLGRTVGHVVVEDTGQVLNCIYAPWVITITEGNERAVLTLHGNTLSGPDWAVDWLRRGGFQSDDAADGRDLRDAICAAWLECGTDPVHVTVRRVRPPRQVLEPPQGVGI